jgi:hypothetical protein
MPHRRTASIRRHQFFEELECEPRILSQGTSRQRSVPRDRTPACRLSESVGSLLGLWLIHTWSEPS